MLDPVPRHAGAEGDGVGDALNRWWWPCLMMFGPPDTAIPAFRYVDARWKTRTIHQQRLAAAEVRRCDGAAAIASRASRSRIRRCITTMQAGHWAFGEIDWEEFRRVLSGDGPCNRDRLAARRKAHEDGALRARSRGPHGPWNRRTAERRHDGRIPRPGCGRSSSGHGTVFAHRHAGSVHAADAEMALQAARGAFTPVAAKVCRSGSFPQRRSSRPIHRTKSRCSNRRVPKSTGIRHFTRCLMRSQYVMPTTSVTRRGNALLGSDTVGARG